MFRMLERERVRAALLAPRGDSRWACPGGLCTWGERCRRRRHPGAGRLRLGLWHGIITPVTFVISLFNENVNIYEVHNNGNWYNFGFVFGLSIVFERIQGERSRQAAGAVLAIGRSDAAEACWSCRVVTP